MKNEVIQNIQRLRDSKTPCAQATLVGVFRGWRNSIRWAMQHGVLPLPKSITPSRIKENLDIFNFEISDSDMRDIDRMEYCGGSGLNPDEIDF